MSDWIEIGSALPRFSLLDDQCNTVTSSQFRGRPLVIYFYPKDDTPGCTREACAFRDVHSKFQKLGASVVGISGDSIESHAAFRDKYSLNFPLLADQDHALAKKLGAYREINRYGKKSWGVQRSTFLVNPDGHVTRVWKRVLVDGHEQKVLEAIGAMIGNS